MKTTAHDRQSIFDVAIQRMGSAESAFILALDNNLSMTDELFTGQELDLKVIDNREIKEHFKNRRLKPATSLTQEDNVLLGQIFDYTFETVFE